MIDLNYLFQKEILLFIFLTMIFSFFRRYKIVLILELLLNLYLLFFIFFRKNPLDVYPLVFLIFMSLLIYIFSRFKKTFLIAFSIPILTLVSARLLPKIEMADLAIYGSSWAPWLFAHTGLMSSVPIIGLSYLVFRWYRFLLDSKNTRTSLLHFLIYSFYVPIFYIGPIASYSEFYKSLNGTYHRTLKVCLIGFIRILWGAFKFYPLASLFFQMTFSRLLMNKPESIGIFQFLISCAAYPAYLYLNFSGFIDIVIGVCALFGIHISKNFDRPYLATSVQDFWRRWHISLTTLLKDLIHLPVLKLLNRLGIQNDLYKYIFSVCLVFVAMAYWHGNTLNFYFFSAIQFFFLSLQRFLKGTPFTTQTPILIPLKTLSLWIYIAFSFFFFENSWEQIQIIFSKLVNY